MKKETAEKKHTISLSDERPVIITSRYWPVIASASEDTDHNHQELFRRYYLRARQHDTGQEIIGDETILNPHSDGRCLVYGWSESSWQGESGEQAGYRCQIEDVPEMIRKVADYIGADESLADECIADLPPQEEDDGEETLSLTITVPRTEANARAMIDSLIRLEQDMRAATTKEIKPGNTTADDLAAQRRRLQEEMGLVLTHDQIDEIARANKRA